MKSEKIIISFVYPPIPTPDFDYAAHWDGDEPNDDGQMLQGRGPTAIAAVRDLMDLTEERDA